MQFKKWKKNIICIFKNLFLHQKKFNTTKNAIFGLKKKPEFLVVLNFFLVQKLIFCHFEMAKMCFYTFEIALFSNFRALCLECFGIVHWNKNLVLTDTHWCQHIWCYWHLIGSHQDKCIWTIHKNFHKFLVEDKLYSLGTHL